VLGHADRLTPDQQIAVQALARLWITGDRAELLRVDHDEPLDERAPIALPIFRATVHLNAPTSATRSTAEATQDHPPETLPLVNGSGGWSEDGAESVIRLGPGTGRLRLPPPPSVNGISPGRAGRSPRETGAGYK